MAKISSVINKIRQWANKLLALPLYPIALAWYVILFLYLHNVEELTIGVTRTPLIVSFVAIAATTCAAYIWFRNWSKSALIIVLLLVFLYFYEPVFQTASSLLAAIGVHARQGWILIGLFGLLVALLSWQLRRWAGDIAKLTSVINVVSLLLVGITVVQIIPHEAQRLTSENLGVDKQAISEIVNLKSTQKPSQLPDVYYIIFDKYASNQSLKDYYDFDNQQLATALEERGFYVASDARTNYPSTIFSLSSSLNMNYIQDVVNMSDPSLSRGTTLKWLLSHNAVGKLFQKQGYTYYHLGNWYDLTRRVEVADSNLLYEDEISQQNFVYH